MAIARVEFLMLQYSDFEDGIREIIKPTEAVEVGWAATPVNQRPIASEGRNSLVVIHVAAPMFVRWGQGVEVDPYNSTLALPGKPLSIRPEKGDAFSFMLAPGDMEANSSSGPARMVRVINGMTDEGSKVILPYDALRKGLTIRNRSSAAMMMSLDGPGSFEHGYPLDSNRSYSFEYEGLLPMNEIELWCAEAGHRYAIIYSTDGEPYNG